VLRGLEPHRRPVAPMRELALERAAQVIDLFLVDEKVAVAGDPELVTADDLNSGEELLDERLHDAGEEHEGAPALLDGHRHDARQRAGRLHDGELAVAAERVLALQAYDEVETLVLDAGERARRIEAQRTQHRLHLVLEILLEPTPRLRRPVVAAEQRDLALRERRQQDLVEATILLGHEAGGALVNGRELLLERQAIGRERARAQLEQLLEAGDPDLEELIEIARGDTEEAQPLEQRHRLVEGLREHPAVELEEGQLAVEVEARRLEIGCVHAASTADYGSLCTRGRAIDYTRLLHPLRIRYKTSRQSPKDHEFRRPARRARARRPGSAAEGRPRPQGGPGSAAARQGGFRPDRPGPPSRAHRAPQQDAPVPAARPRGDLPHRGLHGPHRRPERTQPDPSAAYARGSTG